MEMSGSLKVRFLRYRRDEKRDKEVAFITAI
jgi:hypothetical protein